MATGTSTKRHRLGVALLLDEPVRSEIEGLRRAVGDPTLGRIGPHLTLVPPVNVHPRNLEAAIERIRSAAARQPGAIVSTLGPPSTFVPDNPVLYLGVGGDIDRLRRLRDDVFQAPLERKLTWPWVPHVTLGDGIAEDRIHAALAVMRDYACVATFDRVVLLEERAGRVWVPLADACLEPPAVIGKGGIPLTIVRGRNVDPYAGRAMAEAGVEQRTVQAPTKGSGAQGSVFSRPIVLTAHTGGSFAGIAGAWVDGSGPRAGVFVAEGYRQQGIGSHLLSHLESAARREGWEFPAVLADGPAAFYESRSGWVRAGTALSSTRLSRTPPPSSAPAS